MSKLILIPELKMSFIFINDCKLTKFCNKYERLFSVFFLISNYGGNRSEEGVLGSTWQGL